jgi:hypothetical protein
MRLAFTLAALLVCVILLFGCVNKKEKETKAPSSSEINFIYPSTDESDNVKKENRSSKTNDQEEKNISVLDTSSSNNLSVQEDGSEGSANYESPHTGGPSASTENNELMPPPPPE